MCAFQDTTYGVILLEDPGVLIQPRSVDAAGWRASRGIAGPPPETRYGWSHGRFPALTATITFDRDQSTLRGFSVELELLGRVSSPEGPQPYAVSATYELTGRPLTPSEPMYSHEGSEKKLTYEERRLLSFDANRPRLAALIEQAGAGNSTWDRLFSKLHLQEIRASRGGKRTWNRDEAQRQHNSGQPWRRVAERANMTEKSMKEDYRRARNAAKR